MRGLNEAQKGQIRKKSIHKSPELRNGLNILPPDGNMGLPPGGKDGERRRVCGTCKVEKPFSEFAKDSKKPCGRRYICKECDNKSRKNRRETKKRKLERRKRDRHIYRTLSVEEYSVKEVFIPFSRSSDSWDQIIRDFIEDAM